jgi:2-dehydropantoate 2-reductase
MRRFLATTPSLKWLSMTDRLAFAVLGPGGIGGLIAALLARRGDDVEVIAGEQTSREITARGIRVESQRFGDFTASVRAATQLAEPVDAVLVTVKATHLDEALQRVPASTLGQGLVIPFLNGFEHVAALRRVYGADRVVPATIKIESARVDAGVIRQTSPFAAIEIGSAASAVAEHLRLAGFDVRINDDEEAMLWDKFAILGPLALLTTAARANVGVIRNRHRDDLIALIDEVRSVAAAYGVAIDGSAILRMVDSAHDSFESSMQRDQAAGRPLEIDALGGAFLRRAARVGVDAPVARRLVEEIQARSVSTSA